MREFRNKIDHHLTGTNSAYLWKFPAYIIRTVHVVHSLSDSKQEALDSLYIFPLVLALRYVYRRITEILQRNCNKQRITMLLEMTCTIQNGVFKKVL